MTEYQGHVLDNAEVFEEPIQAESHIVYIKLDADGNIIAINSSIFLSHSTGWLEIDSGFGDKYALAQGNYLPDTLTIDGVYRYKYIDGNIVAKTDEEIERELLPDIETLKSAKLSEVDKVCTATIHAGTDIELPSATERFSFKAEDQMNLKAALDEVKVGATGYPYHADGHLCRIYSAAEIAAVATALAQHKMYHTTYANHLNVWIRRTADTEELESIVYGVDLPADLAANMQVVLSDMNMMAKDEVD